MLISMLLSPVFSQLPAVSFQHLKRDVNLFASSFNALAEDRLGFIWFGSSAGGGLYRYDGYTLRSFLPDPANLRTSVAGLRILEVYSAPDGMVYVGTNFGFSIINPVSGEIRSINNRYDLNPNESVGVNNCFLGDTIHDELWIGTAYGLAKLNKEAGDSITLLRPDAPVAGSHMPEKIVRILQDHRQAESLWLGTSGGLFRYDINTDSYAYIPGPEVRGLVMSISEMYQDHSGIIWMTAGEGFVLKYNAVTDQWKVYKIPLPEDAPAEHKSIMTIHPAGEEEAWVGTMASVGKLNFLTGQFESWSYDPNRPEGVLPRGIFRNILNDRHGRLWIASWFGIQYARQAFMEPSGAVPDLRVAITAVDATPIYETSPRPFMYTNDLSLRKDQRDVTFQYLLPNPLDPAAVTYQYMLSGFDKDWITTDQRTVRYSKLNGGSYSFKVRAKEGNAASWTETTSLHFEIPKRLAEYWWFWGIVGSLLLTMAVALYKLLVSRAKKQERMKAEFEHQVSEIQMEALRAQMNPHFLFNSLNSIKYFAISKSKEETAAYLSKFSLLVRSILNNSKSRTISLKDELDALQLYIEIEHLRLDGKFDYLIDIDSGIHVKQAQIPPMILQPYVENAIWHGLMHKEGRGKLLVQVKDMGHQIQCIIEDNGIGRAQAAEYRGKETDHKKSVGMQITSDRIALINRIYMIDTQVHVIDLEDENGLASGTRVVINIPLIRDEEE
jgi:ligand-binding sensor domain-containing protein